jgi:hypothetical protein
LLLFFFFPSCRCCQVSVNYFYVYCSVILRIMFAHCHLNFCTNQQNFNSVRYQRRYMICYDMICDMIYIIWYILYDIWYDMWYGMKWCVIWYIIHDIWYMIWHDTTWRDMTWRDMTWHDMIYDIFVNCSSVATRWQ